MAAVEKLDKLTCRIQVQIGQTASGSVKTANVNIANVSKTGYTADEFLALCGLIEPILAQTAWVYQAVKTFEVEEG